MGHSIGGNGLGGMCGRLATGLLADFVSWRVAMAGVAIVGFVATAIFWRALPPSRHFTPQPLRVRPMVSAFSDALRDPGLAPLYANGFIFMGSLIATYNYLTYHLLAPPYSLRQSVVGSIFIVYLLGIVASAWAGAVAGRVGRARMATSMFALMFGGLVLTLMRPLACVIVGVTAITCGFFGGHSTTSAWVGLRATRNKAQASALYMFFFYVGSSLAGSLGGAFWTRWQWPGVVGFVTTMVFVGVGMVVVARERAPLVAVEA
jgi:YNFM family putative membrane transporter